MATHNRHPCQPRLLRLLSPLPSTCFDWTPQRCCIREAVVARGCVHTFPSSRRLAALLRLFSSSTPRFLVQLYRPQGSILKTCSVLHHELSNRFRLPSRDGMKVVEDLVRANILAVGQVGIAVEDALHVRRFSSSGQNVTQEVCGWLRLVRERLFERVGKGFRELIVGLCLVSQAVGAARVGARIKQAGGSDCCYILTVNPAEPCGADVMLDNSTLDIALPAVAEQVLHEDLGSQMSESDTGPLDVAFNELVPAIMRNARVIVPACPQVNDMLYTGSLCGVHEVFTLPQHVDGVACGHKDAVDAVKGRRQGLNFVEIQMDNGHAQLASLVDVTCSRNNFDVCVLYELGNDGSTHLAGRSHDENACFV